MTEGKIQELRIKADKMAFLLGQIHGGLGSILQDIDYEVFVHKVHHLFDYLGEQIDDLFYFTDEKANG